VRRYNKGVGARDALSKRLSERKSRGKRMAAAEKEAAARLDKALSAPGAAADDTVIAAAVSAAAAEVHAASLKETRAAAPDIPAAARGESAPAPPGCSRAELNKDMDLAKVGWCKFQLNPKL
jgi:hypothetical protein